MSKLALAISIAATAFEEITDKGGQPYILHCLRVMNKMNPNDNDLRIIAVLHDLLEDTDYTIDHLKEYGFSDRVTTVLQFLTKDENIPYQDYIDNICLNEDAISVKIADLEDNIDITRLPRITESDVRRMRKYFDAHRLLTSKNIRTDYNPLSYKK